MSYNAIVAGAAFVRIAMDDASLRAGLKEAQKRVNGFAKSWEVLKNKMSLNSSGAFFYLTNSILPIANVINQYKEFNDQILALKAISGASAAQTKSLEKYIRQLGATTAFTAKQVAQGAVELSRMGFSSGDVKAGLKPALDLVRATGQETWMLGEISAYAASALRIFGLKGRDFSDVCDVMAYAANASNADINDMGEALKIAGPSAHAVNEDLRDTAAALMLMSNAGIKGSLAGTSLRKIYQSLAAQSGKTANLTSEQIKEGVRGIEALQNLGVRLVDPDTGNLRKAADIMKDLAAAVTKMKSGEKINFATQVFDLRGSLGALTMLNDPAALQEFRSNLDNVAGYAAKTAAEMEQDIGGLLRLFFSRLAELGLQVGKLAADIFTPLLRSGTEFFEKLSKFIQKNQFAIRFFGGLAMAGLALGATFKIVAVSMDFLQNAFTPLFSAMSHINNLVIGLGKTKDVADAMVSARAVAHAERLKSLTKQKEDAERIASDDRRHYEEMHNSAREAKQVVASEMQKMKAAETRLAMSLEAQKVDRLKMLAQKQADAFRIASENKRHYNEMRNLAQSASMHAQVEAQKIAASKARIAMLEDVKFEGVSLREVNAMTPESQKSFFAASRDYYGANQARTQLSELQTLTSGLGAQETAFAQAQKAADKAAAAADNMKQKTLQSIGAMRQAQAAYRAMESTPAQDISGKRTPQVIEAQKQYNAQTRALAASQNALAKAEAEAAAARNVSTASTLAAAAASDQLDDAIAIGNKGYSARMKFLSKMNAGVLLSQKHTLRRAAIIWKASIQEIVASKMAVAASKQRRLAYYWEAVSAKVAAGATLAFAAALNFLKANWVTLAIMAIVAAFQAVSSAIESAKQKVRDYNEELAKSVEKGEKNIADRDQQRAQSRKIHERLKELEELSKTRRLTDKELAEAQDLRERSLYKEYIRINMIKGTLKNISDIKFQDLKKEMALDDAREQLRKLEKQLNGIRNSYSKLDDLKDRKELKEREDEIIKKQKSLGARIRSIARGDKNAVLGEDIQLTGDSSAFTNMSESAKKVADAQKQILEIEKEIAKYRRTASQERLHQLEQERKKAMDNLDLVIKADEKKYKELLARDAELGMVRSEEEINADIKKAVKDMSDRGGVTREDLYKEMLEKENKLKDLDKRLRYQLIDPGSSDVSNISVRDTEKIRLEQEIATLKELVEPYIEARNRFNTLIEERNKARDVRKRRAEIASESEAAQERISANEAKRAEQKKYFDELKAIAEAEAQERIKKYNDFIKELEQENKEKEKKAAEDKEINSLLNTGRRTEAIALLQKLLSSASAAYSKEVAKYNQMREKFLSEESEGKTDLSEREGKALDKQQEALKAANERMFGYRSRLEEAKAAINQSAFSSIGSFSLRALQGQLGGSPEERTAKASEEQVRLQKKIFKNLNEKGNLKWE